MTKNVHRSVITKELCVGHVAGIDIYSLKTVAGVFIVVRGDDPAQMEVLHRDARGNLTDQEHAACWAYLSMKGLTDE
jgi:hypothetical protein